MMNAYMLENLTSSVMFFLLIATSLLLLAVIVLIRNNRMWEKRQTNSLKDLHMFEQGFLTRPEPVIYIDDAGHVLRVNAAALELMQCTREDVIGKNFSPYTIIQQNSRQHAAFEQALKDTGKYAVQGEIETFKTRRSIPCRLRFMDVGSSRYQVKMTPGADTLRASYEESLTQARIDEIEALTDVGFWTYSYKTRETVWSHGLYRLLGAEINTVKPDLSFLNRSFGEGGRAAMTGILMAIKNQQPYSQRMTLTGYDGRPRTLQIELRHQMGFDLDTAYTLGIVRGITSGKAVYEALAPMNLIVLMLDEHLVITHANASASSAVGKTAEQMIGRPVEDIFGAAIAYPPYAPRFVCSVFTDAQGRPAHTIWQSIAIQEAGAHLTFGVNLDAAVRRLKRWEEEGNHEEDEIPAGTRPA